MSVSAYQCECISVVVSAYLLHMRGVRARWGGGVSAVWRGGGVSAVWGGGGVSAVWGGGGVSAVK